MYYLLKGLEKGEEPPPSPPAEEPRTPSDEERSQSVELKIQGLNASQVGLYFLVFDCEVEMTGYWPSSFYTCLWAETESQGL